MAKKAAKKQEPAKDAISKKMAVAKERLGLEVKALGDLIDREITNAGEWPPAPEISMDIKRRSMALGARAVKLLDAVDKLELMRNQLESENENLSGQVHKLRMQSSGISPAELAHLKMENQVLKEHVAELEAAITAGTEGEGAVSALKAENANLKAQLKEQEDEVTRLLGASTEAEQFREEAEKLREELESSHMAVETLREEVSGQAKVLASIWAQSGEEGGEEEARILALREQVAALERENEQLMEKGRVRLQEVKRQRDDLAQKIMDLAESSAERAESAIEEIIGLQKERDELKKVILTLEKHIGELEEELDAKEEELESRKGN